MNHMISTIQHILCNYKHLHEATFSVALNSSVRTVFHLALKFLRRGAAQTQGCTVRDIWHATSASAECSVVKDGDEGCVIWRRLSLGSSAINFNS